MLVMLLIVDTFCGLVNQFYDILFTISFCRDENLKYSFRHCSFRKPVLFGWYDRPFGDLFDDTRLKEDPLYVPFESIEGLITAENSFNQEGKKGLEVFPSKQFKDNIYALGKEYVFIKQIWPLLLYKMPFIINYIHYVTPNKELEKIFQDARDKLIHPKEKYNCLHYRYEIDFTSHFRTTVDSLQETLSSVKYQNPRYRLFVATSSIDKLLDLDDPKYSNLVYKNENELAALNYEQRAFIDFMFCCGSEEVIGHSKSSFSAMLSRMGIRTTFYDSKK